MAFQCIYCKKRFTSKSILENHQKSAKYCLKIQEKTNVAHDDIENDNNNNYICEYCNKSFTSNFRFQQHLKICLNKYKKNIIDLKLDLQNMSDNLSETNKTLSETNKTLYELQVENRILKQNSPVLESDTQKHLVELQSKLQEIALAAIEQKNEVITSMVKKYVKKQPRKHFDCSNVIYILTTPSLKKDRRYILGKAKNLTNRLSTYNKSDEHEVIFYQDCGDEEAMNALEPFVFKKLNEYREQANRERFILPKDKHIDFFKDTITNCFEFLK